MKKPFQDWEEEELCLRFNLKNSPEHHILQAWIEKDAPISEREQATIEDYRKFIANRIHFFNEDELKFHFIAPFMKLADLFGERYSTFTQRPLQEKIKDVNGVEVEVYGIPEFLVAMGLQRPRQHFFFVKEYKPERKSNNDPLGQLLAAMIVAQAKNEARFPLKGCYVIVRNWFFVVLLPDGTYSVSDAFVATQQDIFQIFKILKNIKAEIEFLIQKHNLK